MTRETLIPKPDSNLCQDEFENVLQGRPYDAEDSYRRLQGGVGASKNVMINREFDEKKRMELIGKWWDIQQGHQVWVSIPVSFEYGFNITVGDDVYLGHSCTLLDAGRITIGSRTLIGPNVSLYTPNHPLDPMERLGLCGRESSLPITIGSDVWIGGGATILGGVTIGDGCTIGAGSVITKSTGVGEVVVGNPGRVIRTVKYDKEECERKSKEVRSKRKATEYAVIEDVK